MHWSRFGGFVIRQKLLNGFILQHNPYYVVIDVKNVFGNLIRVNLDWEVLNIYTSTICGLGYKEKL